MTRLSSLQTPLMIVLISTVCLLISIMGILNNIVYDFVDNEFWTFLILVILSIAGFIVVGISSVVYYDENNLTIKRFNRKEVIPLDHIDKLYLENYSNRVSLLGNTNYYYRGQIGFKPSINRKNIFFTAKSDDLENFRLTLENR